MLAILILLDQKPIRQRSILHRYKSRVVYPLLKLLDRYSESNVNSNISSFSKYMFNCLK